ncbi:MAG: VCBS repeat-containing protein [Anaerolineales bacterium]|nr:VCBS repeat-containing protein [Anaerolineales bacterium]
MLMHRFKGWTGGRRVFQAAVGLLLVLLAVLPQPRPAGAAGTVSVVIDTETFSGRTYPRVTLENDLFKAVVRARLKGDQWGAVEHGIQDLVIKANNQDQVDRYIDSSAQRGALRSATLLHDGADYKQVLLQFDAYLGDPATAADDGQPAELAYTIWPGSPVIRVEYRRYPNTWTNTVDLGTPGGTRAGQLAVYGGANWRRGYDLYPKSYWNTYAPDGYNDPVDGGSLNYHNHMIMAVANPANGTGYGRVMPIYAASGTGGIQLIKLLLSATDVSGFETFAGTGQAYASLPPFTGYIYIFRDGLTNAVSAGQQIADGNLFPGQPAVTATPSVPAPTPTPAPASGFPAFQPVSVDTQQFGYRAVGDLDGDGRNDIVASSLNPANDATEDTQYVWYQAPNWTRATLRDLFANPITYNGQTYRYKRADGMQLADIDRDGDLDIVTRVGLAGSDTAGLVIWLENPRPAGALTAPWNFHPISGGYTGTNYYAKDIGVADLDRDGKLDVVTRWHTQVFVWFQDSPDAWTARVTDIPAHEGMDLGDLDGDGDADIVLNGFYLKNPGTWASPGQARTGAYTRYTIDTRWFSGQTAGQAWQQHNAKVAVGDLDADGRLDVVLANSELPDYEIAWYSAADAAATSWTKRGNIAALCSYCHNLRIADFNKDGRLDVLAGGMENTGVSNPDKGLTVYYGDGGRTWTARSVTGQRSYSAAIGDLGDDGDVDLVTVRNWDAGPLEIWENAAGPLGLDAWTYIAADTTRGAWGNWDAPNWLRYFGLGFADVTGDHYLDIVSGRYFYRNPGGDMAGPWPRVDLGLNIDGLLFVNVDGDVYGDLIGTRGSSVYWLEANDQAGSSWTQRRQIDNAAPTDDHVNPQGYRTADLVAGGRPEIILNNGDTLFYYQIPANPETGAWTRVTVAAGTNGEGIGVGDINRDGAPDLAAVHLPNRAVVEPRQIKWLLNPKTGAGAWTPYLLRCASADPACQSGYWRTDGTAIDRVEVADINRDGRPDILVTEEEQVLEPKWKTYLFEAPSDPANGNWTRRVVATQYTTNSLDVADLDRDGDPDVVLAEHRGTRRLSVFVNDGLGGLTRRDLDQGRENHLGARTVDLDGDGDLDIVGIAWDAYQYLHVWRNDNSGAGGPLLPPTAAPPSPTAPPTASPAATATLAATTAATAAPTATARPTEAAAPAKNLLANPGFETSPSVDYFTHTDGAAQFSWASDQYRSGSRSAKITATGAGGSLSRWLTNNGSVAALPGRTYQGTVWVRFENVPGNVVLTVNFWGPGVLDYLGGKNSTALSGTSLGWKSLTVSATAPANARYMRLEMRIVGAGTVWFDDGQVFDLSAPAATAPPTASPAATATQTATPAPSATRLAAASATPTATQTAAPPTATVVPTDLPSATPTVTAPAAPSNTPSVGEAQVTPTSTPPEVPPNGGFEAGAQPWAFWVNPGGGGRGSFTTTGTASAGAAGGKVSVTSLPTDRNVQLYQAGLVLQPNTRYRLSFTAYSNTGHDLWLQLIQHGEPYTNYGLRKTVVDLTTQWQVYTCEFTTANFSAPVSDGRLVFFLGDHARRGDVYYLDEVVLTALPAN